MHFERADFCHCDSNGEIRSGSERWTEAKARCNSRERRHTLSFRDLTHQWLLESRQGRLRHSIICELSGRLKKQSDDLRILENQQDD